MTESTAAPQDADDARLLNMVRAGDPDAFEVLSERHRLAAQRLARLLTRSAREADELVEESFAAVLAVTRRGGGPSNAVRPYVLTAVRRGYAERLSGEQTGLSDDQAAGPAEPGEPFPEPGTADLRATLTARAYLSLPGSWRAVLWHTEVEHAGPEDLAQVLGLDRNRAVALRRQATEGLRQACLQLHLSGAVRPRCRPVVERLGAFLRDAQSVGNTATVTEHLSNCADCRPLYEELAGIRGSLRANVAPLVLGSAADAYLAQARNDSTAATAARPGAAGGEGDAGGLLTAVLAARRPGRLGRISRPYRVLAAATGAALAAVAVIAALAATIGTPGRSHQLAAAPSRAAAAHASPSPSPAPSSASPAPDPTPSAVAPAVAGPAAASSRLSVSIDMSRQWLSGHVTQVIFRVVNDGPATTGALTASIALPAGATLLGFSPYGGGQPGTGPGGSGGNGTSGGRSHTGWPDGTTWSFDGWTCQPTASAVTCTRGPLAARGHAEGTLVIMIGGWSACGQPVRLSVTSGSVTASAAENIPC